MRQAERNQGQQHDLVEQSDPEGNRELQHPGKVPPPQSQTEREHDKGEDEREEDVDYHWEREEILSPDQHPGKIEDSR